VRTWQIQIEVPDNITREQLTGELNELCQAGFDLEEGQYTVTVQPQAEEQAA
jgi:hypothetical protein